MSNRKFVLVICCILFVLITLCACEEYKKTVGKYDKRGDSAFGAYERFEFYEQAKKCYCVLQSGETSIYANVILQKGVIK